MNVLVTGASGFIGHNVLLRAPRDWQVTAVFNNTSGLDAFGAMHGLTHVRAVRCDLTDVASVAELARRQPAFDACLYLAANGDPTKSAERPAWDLTLNTLALVTLLERVTFRHFVYVSSGAVYDGLRGEVSPQSFVAPRLPYAISKLASEHYVRAFAERRKSIDSYINVRFFGAYGPYEPSRKITTKWMRAVMDGQREFTIRGNGDNLVDFMHVDDAVDGFLTLTSSCGRSDTVDFASGAPITVNEVVQTMARVLGVEVMIRHEGHTEEFIEFRSVDRSMRDRFGVTPSISLDDGIRRLHRFLVGKQNGAGQPA